MLSLTIKDTKNFMSQLLIKEVFDKLYLSEAVIKTACSYTIGGEVNRDFYTKEEFEALQDTSYIRYGTVKPFCFSLIKGNKVPSSMKMVFLMPDELTQHLISKCNADISLSDVNGLFINMKYLDGKVTFVTGTSLKIFTMDKSLEQEFDTYVKQFLSQNNMDFEEN